ncbi:MAG: hypothetical protein ACP5VN_09710 [Acidobacteriota bacterium]
MGKRAFRRMGWAVAVLLAAGALPVWAITCSCQGAHCSASQDCPNGCICVCNNDVCACQCLDEVKPPVRIKLPPGRADGPLTVRDVLAWLKQAAGIQGVVTDEGTLDRPVCLPPGKGEEGWSVAAILAAAENQAGFRLLGLGVPVHNLSPEATVDISLHGMDAERLAGVLTWLAGREVRVEAKGLRDYEATGVTLETILTVLGAS